MAAFFCIPLAAFVMVSCSLNQLGMLDPFIYLGYATDYGDLIARDGNTYYSTRLVHILPNAWAAFLLGDTAGYHVIRYLLLVAATASIYRIARHYSGEWQAWFLTVYFVTHVWLLRSVFWDYYDGTVVIWTLVSIACLLPQRRETAWHVAAGFAAALAANGNPVGLIVVVASAPAWLAERPGRSWRQLARLVAAAAIGFVACYGLLILAMAFLNPPKGWRFDENTLNMLSAMFSGDGQRYFVSLQRIFLERQLYEPLIFPFFSAVSLTGLLASSRRGGGGERRRALGVASYVLGMTAFFAIFHFVLQWGLLALFYYLIYFLPAALMATASLIGPNPLTMDRRTLLAMAGGFFVLHFVLVRMAMPFLPATLPLIVLAFLALGWLALRMRKPVTTATKVSLLLLALLCSDAFFNSGAFRVLFNGQDRQALEWDVRNGALYLHRLTAKTVPRGTPVSMWYGVRDPNLRSINYIHLGEGRLSVMEGPGAQMPLIDASVEARLAKSRYLAVLGDRQEIEAAVSAIKEAGFSFDIADRGAFEGQQWAGYQAVLLRMTKR